MFFMFIPGSLGITNDSSESEYITKLFDDTIVHEIDILVDTNEWESMLENAVTEEYIPCDVVIDGERFSNVGIRAKGNTSLTQIAQSRETDRYSFKIEFDHYDGNNLCYGLDKLTLNNIMSDTTYMKDYLVYDMMRYMDVAASYSSFMHIKVNGDDWGLYLGVESVEESFLVRNYGRDYGQLYKPETMGNGEHSGFERFKGDMERGFPEDMPDDRGFGRQGFDKMAENMGEDRPFREDFKTGDVQKEDTAGDMRGFGRGSGMREQGKGANLVYTDNNIESYSTIFNSAKTIGCVTEYD